MSPIQVVLVGRETEGEENLGVRYVGAALADAGHNVEILSLNRLDEIPALARRLIDQCPGLLGLALSDPTSTLNHLVLANYLRELTYSGMIVGGGAFATLARHGILARHPAIDAIVRHAGEMPMVELANRLAERRSWHDVAGLTTRAGDGDPCTPTANPFAYRPLRAARLHRVLGVGVARVLASRGCHGGCPYCGSSALRGLALDEGRRAGLDLPTLRSLGIGARQRRTPEDVADEVAALYHERGVRVLQLLDDNLVGGSGRQSRGWLGELVDALARRAVKRTAWTMMIDAPSVDDSMLDLLEALGVVRLFIGVESLTEAGLHGLGRPGGSRAAWNALERAHRRGMRIVFNDIVVHPAATGSSIHAELEALARVPDDVYFEVNPLIAYAGTDLYRTLCREGRSTGGTLGTNYFPDDLAARRFHATLVRMALFLMARGEPALYAHRMSLNLAIARHLGLGRYEVNLDREMTELLSACNHARLEALRSGLALSQTELSANQREPCVQAILNRMGRELDAVAQRVEILQRRLDPGLAPGQERKNLLLSRAMTGMLLVSLGALQCGGQTSRDTAGTGGAGTPVGAAGGGGNAPGRAGADDTAGAAGVAGASAGGSAGGSAGALLAGESGAAGTGGEVDISVLPSCGKCRLRAQGTQPVDCTKDDTCALLNVPSSCSWIGRWALVVDAGGRVVDVISQYGDTPDSDLKQCILNALANEQFSCLSGHEVLGECAVIIY